MMKKGLMMMLLVGLMLVGVVGTASADVLVGKGRLVGQGRGLVHMEGDVRYLALSGKGTLIFSDKGETDTPIINGEGDIRTLPDGTMRIENFDGTFRLRNADDVSVNFVGHDIKLAIKGKGFVILKGQGTYRVDGVGGRWFDTDVQLGLEE